jgi:hypothetical protein
MSRGLLPLALLLALGAAIAAVPEGVRKDTPPADLTLEVVPGLGPRQVPRDNPLTAVRERHCPFLTGVTRVHLPVTHGCPLRYPKGGLTSHAPPQEVPA